MHDLLTTTDAQPAPPPYQPSPRQRHSRGTQTVTPPAPKKTLAKPPTTLLDKLNWLDRALLLYVPILASIVFGIIVGLSVLATAVVVVVGPPVMMFISWRGSGGG